MKRPAAIVLQLSLAAIALFVLGFCVYPSLFEVFEPKVQGIDLVITDMGHFVRTSFLFPLVLALSPVLVFYTWKQGAIVSPGRKFISLLIVLAFVIIAILLRRQAVKAYFTHAAKQLVPAGGSIAYPIDPVNFVYYIIAGFCIGCIAVYFLLKKPS
jgi:glucan phosphoethanolaminetransferase (alkaline phosphatase superfamily)